MKASAWWTRGPRRDEAPPQQKKRNTQSIRAQFGAAFQPFKKENILNFSGINKNNKKDVTQQKQKKGGKINPKLCDRFY